MPPDAHPPPTAPPPLAHSGSGPRAVFFTEGELTLDSGSGSPSKGADRWSPGSVTGGGRPSPPRYAAAQQHPAAPPAFHQQREQPSHSAGNARLERLEAQNYEMHRACQELQARLEAATAAAATPPPPPAASTHQLQPGGAAAEQADPQELRQLERRLAAKGREAAAAAQAAEAAQAALAARDAELEGERQRAAALADEVARWKDECVQKEREARGLAQRLEAATGQCGLLDDGMAALKRQAGELGTALAQRASTVRQLEDRLRALQASQHCVAGTAAVWGSEGSKDRQLEAAQSEAEAARGERDALRRECADLQQRNAELEAEVRRLGTALQQASKERAVELRSYSRDLELIAAVPPQQQAAAGERRASSSGSPPLGAASRYSASPRFAHQPPAAGYPAPGYAAQALEQHRRSSQQAETAAATGFGWSSGGGQQASLDPRASLQHQPYAAAGAPAWQHHQQQHPQQQHAWQEPAVQPGEASHYAGSGSQCDGVPYDRYSAGGGRYATADSDAGSVGGHGAGALRPPTAPQQAWEERGGCGGGRGGAATPPYQQQPQRPADEALAGQLGGLALHTPTASSTSPFATDDTLQARRQQAPAEPLADMLARTQALESALLALNAERNELQAESARMPSHTTGRTVQERRRRAEVEARLEVINRECSSVRLALRRLGVK